MAATPGADLLAAAEAGDVEHVRDIIGAGTEVDTQREDGSTALLLAALGAHAATVRLLLAHDASVTIAKQNGATPIFAAAASDAVECIKILCAAGAMPDVVNAHGVTPLQMAAHKNHKASLRELLSVNASVSASDRAGNSALHKAARAGATDAIDLLLAHERERAGTAAVRAALSQRNDAAQTAVELAMEVNMAAGARALIKAQIVVDEELAQSSRDLLAATVDLEARLASEVAARRALEASERAALGAARGAEARAACESHLLTTSLLEVDSGLPALWAQVEECEARAQEHEERLEAQAQEHEEQREVQAAEHEEEREAQAAAAQEQLEAQAAAAEEEREAQLRALTEELESQRHEFGCQEAALAVARESHASSAERLRACLDENEELQAELQAAREELGGGTLTECKLQLRECSSRLVR